MLTWRSWTTATATVAVVVAACGGTAVVDPGAGGATSTSSQGGTTSPASTSTPASSTVVTTSTGMTGCVAHEDCGDGLCLFGSGQCVPACGEFCDSCGPGTFCNQCATSSCPDCDDCLAACVPIEPGQCDENDDCAPGQVCLWFEGRCADECGSGACADPNMVCEDCATGSCCGCEDCVSACLPLP